MRRRINYGDGFVRDIKSLQKRFRRMEADIMEFQGQIESGQVVGVRAVGYGHVLYKARVSNRSAQRGKSGGFRILYALHGGNMATFLHIYSKTDKNDASPGEIIERLRDIG